MQKSSIADVRQGSKYVSEMYTLITGELVASEKLAKYSPFVRVERPNVNLLRPIFPLDMEQRIQEWTWQNL